jgi:SAM-dependent methyltransferase
MNRATRSGMEYWDDVAVKFAHDDPSLTWRAYMQSVYCDLMQRWMVASGHGASASAGVTLKTDLFEEAVTPHHLFDALGPQGIGIDVSMAVVRAAFRRLAAQGLTEPSAAPRVLVADLRQLPFASGALDRVLSGSSLDHFTRKEDIAVALAEMARCLAPRGCLVVTFDNPHNPIVWLRNALPFHLLSKIGLVPYFVGATYSRDDITREFAALGLRVTELSAVVHVPRAPAIWLGMARERWGDRAASRGLMRVFRAWDALESTPLRFRTGYYLAVRAEKAAT